MPNSSTDEMTAAIPAAIERLRTAGVDALFLAVNSYAASIFLTQTEQAGYHPTYYATDLDEVSTNIVPGLSPKGSMTGAQGVTWRNTGAAETGESPVAFDEACRQTYEQQTGTKVAGVRLRRVRRGRGDVRARQAVRARRGQGGEQPLRRDVRQGALGPEGLRARRWRQGLVRSQALRRARRDPQAEDQGVVHRARLRGEELLGPGRQGHPLRSLIGTPMSVRPDKEHRDPATLAAVVLEQEATRQASAAAPDRTVLPDDLLPGVGLEPMKLRGRSAIRWRLHARRAVADRRRGMARPHRAGRARTRHPVEPRGERRGDRHHRRRVRGPLRPRGLAVRQPRRPSTTHQGGVVRHRGLVGRRLRDRSRDERGVVVRRARRQRARAVELVARAQLPARRRVPVAGTRQDLRALQPRHSRRTGAGAGHRRWDRGAGRGRRGLALGVLRHRGPRARARGHRRAAARTEAWGERTGTGARRDARRTARRAADPHGHRIRAPAEGPDVLRAARRRRSPGVRVVQHSAVLQPLPRARVRPRRVRPRPRRTRRPTSPRWW